MFGLLSTYISYCNILSLYLSLTTKAMESGGVGLSKKSWSLRRSGAALLVACAAYAVRLEEKAKRCLALMTFVVLMWAPRSERESARGALQDLVGYIRYRYIYSYIV